VKKLVILLNIFVVLGFCEIEAQQPAVTPSAGAKNAKQPSKAKSADPKASASPAPKGNTTNNLFGNGQGDDRPKGPTDITARDQAQFDSRDRTAVFYGNVKVVDPQFTMTADKLTAYMNKDEEGGGLRQADAEGNVIIVHINQPKTAPAPGPDGQPVPGNSPAPGASPGQSPVAAPSATPIPNGGTPPANGAPTPAQTPVRSVSKSERAVYVTKDGTITLTGWPQVTQGVNTHISTEPGVKMIIYNDGRLQTFGSTRTVIQDRSQPTTNQPTTNKPNATNAPQ
jgi:lipopolysaccharide export system protein LptA